MRWLTSATVFRCGAGPGAARREGRRPRGVVGEGLLPPGGRGGQGDHRRLRAGDRQAGRARPAYDRTEHAGQARGGVRGRAAARLRCSASSLPTRSREWAYEDRLVDLDGRIGPFSDLFDPDALDVVDAARRQDRPDAPSTGCRWARDPTTSTSGRACWSRPASPSTISRRSGRRSGRSGATGCSRRCARPWAATTSGASACRCRPRPSTQRRVQPVPARLRGAWLGRDGRLQDRRSGGRAGLIKALDSYTAI